MSFPSLKPSKRSYDSGDFPVKSFRAQSGVESRILYGNRRTGMKLDLSFENITDVQAELFLDHYDETQGSYLTFSLPSDVLKGWSGNLDAINTSTGNSWRYDEPPSVSNVRPGISTVSIKLVGVL
jgi:hypothetical protein